MAKKIKKQPQQQQQQQQLSPENYIRQKARNLPIHECWINHDWEIHGEASITISRIHANGHFTFGVYLVDLYCLGTKDTFYNFNVDTEIFANLWERTGGDNNVKVPYELVHNIIYAANEFALDHGFQPHKNFTTVTKYILEEDTEDIELIEIECGKDGKPFYVASESDSLQRMQQIINQLEKAVGKDGFSMSNNMESDFEDEDEYESADLEQKKKEFIHFSKRKIDTLSKDEKTRYMDLMDEIFLEISDEEKVDELLDEWIEEINVELIKGEFTNELLGIDSTIVLKPDDITLFNTALELVFEKPKKAIKTVDKLKNKWGDVAFIGLLELILINSDKQFSNNQADEFSSKLEQLLKTFPDYPYFIIQKHLQAAFNYNDKKYLPVLSFDSVFKNKEKVTKLEMKQFVEGKVLGIITNKNINEIEAINYYVNEVDIDDELYIKLKNALFFVRHKLISEYFDYEHYFEL